MTTVHHSARYVEIVNASPFDAWKSRVISATTYGGTKTNYTTLCTPALFNADRFNRAVIKHLKVSCDRCILLASLIEANDIDISQHDGCVKLATILDGK